MQLMGSFIRKCLLISVAIALAACSNTRNIASSPDQARSPEIMDSGYNTGAAENVNQSNMMVDPNKNQPSNLTLNEQLSRLPGVRIQSGRGQYAQWKVDGTSNSFMADTNPLFVVNGNTIGTDYSNVYLLVNPREVVSLSVLKGADASLYGSRGANGVILIRTRPLQ